MAKVVKKFALKQSSVPVFSYYWEKHNYVLFGIGIVLSVIGFFLSSVKPWDSNASLVISPIILVITYVVIFPLAILYTKKKKQTEEDKNQES